MNKRLFMAAAFTACFGLSNFASAQTPIELTFSTYIPPSYEYVAKPMETFVKQVETESKGRVKIKVFHSAQLYDGYQELQAVSRGDVDIVNMTGTYPSGSVPALNIFTLPFMFKDVAHLRRALDGGLLDLGVREELSSKHNTVVLGVGPFDPYEFYSRRAPITSAADFKGKIWATTGAMDARAIQLLGGSPTGMPSSELYLAFDRGVIDGTPRPLLTGMGRSLFEVSKHLSIATFGIDTSILSINKKKWDSLPADIQDIIRRAAKKRDQEQFERVDAFVKGALAKYESHGVKIHKIDAVQIDNMRKLTAPAVKEWSGKVANGTRYLELIEKTKNP
jgi:TRAP-type C4-dicarboxylate transport system substrate-binding protein